MIQLSAPIVQGSDWKIQLAQAIKDPAELLRLLELPESYLAGANRANQLFPLRVPHSYLMRIKKGDPEDPLLRQVLPLDCEAEITKGYSDDPVGDLPSQTVPGLLHKYNGRALLITSPACAIHCRYCFRRHFPYADAKPSQNHWQEPLHYLAAHPDIHEIILSGGDPLSLSDEKLDNLIAELEKIPHLKTLRIHTRLPIVIPQRITAGLINSLSSSSLNPVVVVHVNHANEMDNAVKQAMLLLRNAGITLLNQSVLLHKVNDSAKALEQLSHTLFDSGILPYYLHQLDKVAGAAHFAVNRDRALRILDALRQRLPGYLVPRLVEEHAGEPNKIPLV
ncbi:EF-P beta-lysylation protein EpmB [Kaarinaea lacus]